MANWNSQANDIFLKAIEIGTSDNRQAYLREACDGDDRLMGQVEALLDASQRAGSFLESPPLELNATVDASPVVEQPGTVIGPYKLREQIGEGGMGVVYVAEQERPLRRKVALKIIKPGMDTKEVIARFEAERQALALMEHPHIARVLDAGTTESGRPYFVMELVRGISITEYSDRYRLSTRRRLELFVAVCQAVQHAHQKGIIHRDIKPSNVLVTEHDSNPVPKVIDFGVAKAINQRLTERTIYTRFQQMVGTPMYMSPEQAELSGLDVDTRSDIYSLGVLLYELLTGGTPFDQQRFSEAAFDEIRRIIREEEPPKPSTKISTLGETATEVSAHRNTDPVRLRQQVRGDLDWIVMKALEKDRTRRYATANGLAAEVQRFLTEEPVQARPPSTVYRLRKFARRNKGAAFAATALVAVLLFGITAATTALVWVESERRLAETEKKKALAQREIAEQESERRRRLQYDSDLVVAHHAWEEGHIDRVVELLRQHVPDSDQDDLRAFGWYNLWQRCQSSLQAGVVDVFWSSWTLSVNGELEFSTDRKGEAQCRKGSICLRIRK